MNKIVNVKVDKMRFQNNRTAYMFGLLAIITGIVSLFSTITPPSVAPSFTTAIEIGLNIILILAMFLAAEKSKVYNRTWGIGSLILAVIHFLRIFFEPLKLYRIGIESYNALPAEEVSKYNLWNSVPNGLALYNFIVVVVFISITVALLIFSGLLTLKRHAKLETHKKELAKLGE